MAIVHVCRLLVEATRTVADGGDLPGTATCYYNIRAIERLLRPGVEWREAIPDGMYPAGENGASTPRRDLQGPWATEKAGF